MSTNDIKWCRFNFTTARRTRLNEPILSKRCYVSSRGIYDNIKTAVDLCANQRKVGFWSGKEKGPEHREKDELGFECLKLRVGRVNWLYSQPHTHCFENHHKALHFWITAR